MPVVAFTLSEEGIITLQNALACVIKFSEEVFVEAKKDKLALTTLNMSMSAYASFSFTAKRFFSKYEYMGIGPHQDGFCCSMAIRALLAVFRSRVGSSIADSSRDKDKETTIDRCEVVIEDGLGERSLFVAKIIFRNGMTASHGLSFEAKTTTHARFNVDEAVNKWAISPRVLRQLMDHFGPKIELLDINTEGDNVVNFSCFAEKQYSSKNEEFLSKPLHTSIQVEVDEFDHIEVDDKLHVIISFKDFRAILQHAGITSADLSAAYSNPGRPMKLSYTGDGILCEFVLMTVGEKGTGGQRTKKGKAAARATPGALEAGSRAPSVAAAPAEDAQQDAGRAPSPPRATARADVRRHPQFQMRPPTLPPSTLRSESLFVAQDDDSAWEPVNPDEEEDEYEGARLEWDASNQQGNSELRFSSHINTQAGEQVDPLEGVSITGLDPTQRLSEVRKFGLFSS